MKITPRIVHNVLRVYGAQLVADRKRREKIWIKKKKEGSILLMLVYIHIVYI